MEWEPVPQGSRNGHLTGYRVRYRQTFSNGSDGEIKIGYWTRSITKATLKNLEKSSVYMIEVAGETLAGAGVYSEPITAKTCTGKFKTKLKNLLEVFATLMKKTLMQTFPSSFKKCVCFAVDPCDSSPCLQGRTCIIDQSSYSSCNLTFHCACAVNFTGKFCSEFKSGK